MEEDEAHRVYTLFSRVNEGAKYKQGLGFGDRRPSPVRNNGGIAQGFLSSFVRSTTSFVVETSRKPVSAFGQLYDSDDDDNPAKRQRQHRSYRYADDDDSGVGSLGRGGGMDMASLRLLAVPGGPRPPRGGDSHERRRTEPAEDDEQDGRRRLGTHEPGGGGGGGCRGGNKGAEDYEELIPGYESMNPAERIRARTRLALKQADARVRSGGGDDGRQWTRFALNNEAALDEDGARPGFLAATNGIDAGPEAAATALDRRYNPHGLTNDVDLDLDRAGLNALSFRRTADLERRQQAMKRAEAQHEDAIFGAALPPPPPPRPLPPAPAAAGAPDGRAARHSEPPRAGGGREAERLRDTERARASSSGRGAERKRDRDYDRGQSPRERNRECDRGRDRSWDRDRNRDRSRDRYTNRDRDRGRDKDRGRDRDRGNDSERYRQADRKRGGDGGGERHRGRDRDKEGGRDRDRDGGWGRDRADGGQQGARRDGGRLLAADPGAGKDVTRRLLPCQQPVPPADRGHSHRGAGSGPAPRPGNSNWAGERRRAGGSDAPTAAPPEAGAPPAQQLSGSAGPSSALPAASTATVLKAAAVLEDAAPASTGRPMCRRAWGVLGLNDGDEDGPVMVELDELGVLAAAQAASGVSSGGCGDWGLRAGSDGRGGLAAAADGQVGGQAQGCGGTLGGTLSAAVLQQQQAGLSWRERAMRARAGKATQ